MQEWGAIVLPIFFIPIVNSNDYFIIIDDHAEVTYSVIS